MGVSEVPWPPRLTLNWVMPDLAIRVTDSQPIGVINLRRTSRMIQQLMLMQDDTQLIGAGLYLVAGTLAE